MPLSGRYKKDGELLDPDDLGQGDLISWQVRTDGHVRFDYAAIKSAPYTDEAGHNSWMWHITGGGEYYGTPIVTSERLVEIIDSNETTGVWYCNDWARAEEV